MALVGLPLAKITDIVIYISSYVCEDQNLPLTEHC